LQFDYDQWWSLSVRGKHISGILAREGKALCKCFHKGSAVSLKASSFFLLPDKSGCEALIYNVVAFNHPNTWSRLSFKTEGEERERR
jgi:hypothetical protein